MKDRRTLSRLGSLVKDPDLGADPTAPAAARFMVHSALSRCYRIMGKATVLLTLLSLSVVSAVAQVPPPPNPDSVRFDAEMAEARAERDAVRLYNACGGASVWLLRVDGWPIGGDRPSWRRLTDLMSERFEQWGLLRGGPLRTGLWVYPGVSVVSTTVVRATIRVEKPVEDRHGNSAWLTTWETESATVGGVDAAESVLLEALDEFAAEYLRVNALACR